MEQFTYWIESSVHILTDKHNDLPKHFQSCNKYICSNTSNDLAEKAAQSKENEIINKNDYSSSKLP